MAGPTASVAIHALRDRRARRLVVVLVLSGVVGTLVLLLVLAAVIGGAAGMPAGSTPSDEARRDIPAEYLALYREAGVRRQIDWTVLAGIGKVECDHGRSRLPGCNPPGTVNEAGARGPMQFLGATWRASADNLDREVAGAAIPEGDERRGYATDGNADGIADPWSPADAIHAAARHLSHNGAPDYQAALLAYNPDARYVASVMDYAARYRATPTGTGAGFSNTQGDIPVADVSCPGGGHTTVHVQLAPALQQLYEDANAAGHSLCGGGFRTAAQQIERRRANCGTTPYAIYEMPAGQCSPPTARPGTSRHEQGLAVDFTCDGSIIDSRDDPCSDWLEVHAAEYGLINLPSEPWHYSTDGH